MFPFQFFAASHGNADSKTPVIERKNYEVCTVEYIVSGCGTLEINGKTFHPGADSVYVLTKHSTHRYAADRSDPWKKLFCVIDGSFMEELFRCYGMETIYYIPQCPHVKKYFDALLGLNANTEDGHRRGAVIFHELIAELSRCVYEKNRKKDSPAERLKELLDSRAEGVFQLSEYAKTTPWSEAHLIRTFKRIYEMSPYEYLMTRKLELAKQLLLYSNLSIKEIAENLAFSGQYYFSNYFKRKFGISPKAFREKSATERQRDMQKVR